MTAAGLTPASSAGCRMLVISNIPNPYNDALFAEVAKLPGIALSVAYCAERESNRSWTLPEQKGYAYTILPGITIRGLGRFNPGIFSLLRRFRPTVVLITGSYVFPTMQLLAWWLTVRGVRWYYWSEELNWNDQGPVRNVVRSVMRPVLRRARGILAIGRRAAESFRRLGIPGDRIHLFHYYANTAQFELPPATRAEHRERVRREQNVPADAIAILFIGQLIPRKGVDLLLRAFALARANANAFVMIAGDGPQERELKALADELGIADRTRFAGFIQPAQLPAYAAACDAIVVPSRREGWGLVVPEAMAASLPVLASERVNAAADLIQHGESGLLFPSDDVDALAALLAQVIGSRDVRERLIAGGMRALAPERPTVAAGRLARLICNPGDAASPAGATDYHEELGRGAVNSNQQVMTSAGIRAPGGQRE